MKLFLQPVENSLKMEILLVNLDSLNKFTRLSLFLPLACVWYKCKFIIIFFKMGVLDLFSSLLLFGLLFFLVFFFWGGGTVQFLYMTEHCTVQASAERGPVLTILVPLHRLHPTLPPSSFVRFLH